MKLSVKLTLDGLVRSLRGLTQRLAQEAEDGYSHKPKEGPAATGPLRRRRLGHENRRITTR